MRKTIAILAAAFALAGCGAVPPPEVTFYADGDAVRAHPQILCDLATLTCEQDEDAVVTLAVRPGYPVQISVPAALAREPWGVVFSYLTPDGERVDGSSRIFVPGQFRQYAYTLELPNEDDRLLFAAVQRLAIVQGDTPVPTGYWILRAEA
ncbi:MULTISPECIES: DUF2771 family protein [Actinokineospora]|uniref:DUF2771 family protein n=1 Tax=Actinokineospora fastidiosa TaxID=1816 RepID=A0A918L6U6_9PSEU|nr:MULTISPECIES: DUF2771 family protein [Actinokineospora]UVS76801.1 hypothetical protein Actkin_00496 [Actinokineospora sp. UTMC 2448]GGS15673.1 hypothetical protein GCM10010171_04700 [Actinokineospora fastidiosa]